MQYIKSTRNTRLITKRRIGHFVSAPFIFGLFPILLISDLFIEIYHRVCFPMYGLKTVKRKEYILVMDRPKLKYLNLVQKLFCMYCGYANGLLRYRKEIGTRTEHYWCGIMHQNIKGFKTEQDQVDNDFAKFDDKKDYEDKYL